MKCLLIQWFHLFTCLYFYVDSVKRCLFVIVQFLKNYVQHSAGNKWVVFFSSISFPADIDVIIGSVLIGVISIHF